MHRGVIGSRLDDVSRYRIVLTSACRDQLGRSATPLLFVPSQSPSNFSRTNICRKDQSDPLSELSQEMLPRLRIPIIAISAFLRQNGAIIT